MTFLTIIGTVVPLAVKALESAWYRRDERKRAQQSIKENWDNLTKAIVTEGRRIRSYLEFDRLIGEIDGAISVILQNNRTFEDDDNAFWNTIDEMHQRLQQTICVELQNFDPIFLEDFHKGLIAAGKPDIEKYLQQSNALFEIKSRKDYIEQLLRARPQVGRMKGWSTLIIRNVARDLEGFGGN